MFFTKGVGVHKEKLSSFELALRDAGIEKCNLVYVSSIFPPNCKTITKEKGVEFLKPGQITYCVMAKNETNEPNRLISASIGLAIPKDNKQYGYLSEHHSFGEKAVKSGDYAEDLAATMLATTLGIQFWAYNLILIKLMMREKKFIRLAVIFLKLLILPNLLKAIKTAYGQQLLPQLFFWSNFFQKTS